MAEFFKSNKDSYTHLGEGKESLIENSTNNDKNNVNQDDKSATKSNHNFSYSEGVGDCDDGRNLLKRKYNDLVADLYIHGGETALTSSNTSAPVVTSGSSSSNSLGNCTNSRTGYTDNDDQTTIHKKDALINASDNVISPISTSSITVQPAMQNSSFSFKHFLNSSCSMSTPSTTVTSLDPINSSSSLAPTSDIYTSTDRVANSFQTSTGARPKVPQSTSISNTSISSLLSNISIGGALDSSSTNSVTKMKRSPRFSSFDSQASLVEYAGINSETSLEGELGYNEPSNAAFRLYMDGNSVDSNDIFLPFSSDTNTLTTNSGDYERQCISRSFSNYELPSVSPRRRPCYINTTKDKLSARQPFNSNSPKVKLESSHENPVPTNSTPRLLSTNQNEYPPAPAASALPDFVQDHWMDSWYPHDMNINSTCDSPLGDFLEEPSVAISNNIGGGGVDNDINPAEATGSSKMLPDFLSDGPIIHSSGRLADVAAGLPSNSIGSPEELPMTSHLSRLRLDNERLQCELEETRTSLNHQTRRANELEKQLQEKQRDNTAYNRAMSQNIQMVEENLDKSKKKTAAAQSHITKLKQQVMQLTAEIEMLRHENEMLREEGAVGGTTGATDTPFAASSISNSRPCSLKPSKAQQISNNLKRAASNAENNLRQLLAGVENLRQMAADIDNSESNGDFAGSSLGYSDFVLDCDDYDDNSGASAL